MNGIHDLGGRDGFGRVSVEEDEPVFHADWEARVFGMVAATRLPPNVDAFRHAIERMDPLHYLAASYYERWMSGLETRLLDEGLLEPGEVDARLRGGRAPAPTAARPATAPGPGGARREIGRAPRFAVGDRVRARNLQPKGHTRLPAYARGHTGTIAIVHPAWVLPDTHAHGRGEHAQYAYAVRFSARELFGEDGDPTACVHVDLFESYLEPAP